MFLPGVKRNTRTRTRVHACARARTEASETASTSQCNYRETEQSVTHLSAAGIRAGVLLWHWWGKPGVSLLKHNDRQLHLLTRPRWQTKYLDWGGRQEDGAQIRNTEVTPPRLSRPWNHRNVLHMYAEARCQADLVTRICNPQTHAHTLLSFWSFPGLTVFDCYSAWGIQLTPLTPFWCHEWCRINVLL